MKGLKRTVRKYGKPLGHRKGVYGTELLDYFNARMLIYLPTYKWVLDNVDEVHKVVAKITEKSKNTDLVFLDYNTNDDFRDISSPLSHAGLVKLYIEGRYPSENENFRPLTEDEVKAKKAARKVAKSHKNTNQLNIFNDD